MSLTTTIKGVVSTKSYKTLQAFDIPNSDLRVIKIDPISGTFPSASIVPLYGGTAGTEPSAASFLGYGPHIHGNAVVTGGTPNGWLWSGPMGLMGDKSFGQNTLVGLANNFLSYTFDPVTGNEGIYGNGDSGGGLFVNNGGNYQLAGVGNGITQFFTLDTTSNSFTAINAAIYDANGLYVQDKNGNFVTAASQGITSQLGYASEIAPFENQINAIITPEPTTLALCGVAAAGMLIRRRRA